MKIYRVSRGIAELVLTSALDDGEWHQTAATWQPVKYRGKSKNQDESEN
jgi:hypothetical protein